MNMQETLSAVFPRQSLHLGGPSPNKHWHVPLALHSLVGEIDAAQSLIHIWEPLMEHRIAYSREVTTELGTATGCVVLAGHIAEVALKTLIAQTQPDKAPPIGHDLKRLFNKLEPSSRSEVERRLETLPDYWDQFAESESAEKVFGIARSSFVDWRYVMEPGGAHKGVPKPLLKVAVAVTLLGVNRLDQWQKLPAASP
ncbi:hypothetical protein F4Y93_14780 [Candidatus Poribacteria bacterium]|nr:hypothetical protein [Candidatus Poribacteria bacterium]